MMETLSINKSEKRFNSAFLSALCGLAGHMAYGAEWKSVIGIPDPEFGITQSAPALPAPWNSDVSSFYYVKQGGSSSGNGNPTAPRDSIPDPIPAGSVVIIEGTYNVKHETNPLTANGTAIAPVYIRGLSAENPAVITQKWVVEGSHYIIEYINGNWSNASYNGKLHLQGDHGVVRHGDFRGDTNRCVGGVHIDSGSSYHVVYNNLIHHAGDVNATTDQDCHGTTVPRNVHHVWFLDNEYYNNSGDGIQINGQTSNDLTSHIYVGRNIAHHNKQTGFWSKQASDVIFSQNTVHSHRSSGSSAGDGMGMQYAPENVWFLYNNIYNNEGGIKLASDSGGTGQNHYIIGNSIHNIHKEGDYDPSNSWEAAAISVWGSTNTYVVNNTIWNVDAGINSGRKRGKLNIINNIIDKPTLSGTSHLFLYYSDLVANSIIDHNAYVGPYSARLGSATKHLTIAEARQISKDQNSMENTDPGFIDAASSNFHLKPTSEVIDKGSLADVYDIFYQRYGLRINVVDSDTRITKPSGAWDIGAFEYITGEKAAPLPPTDLEITIQFQ